MILVVYYFYFSSFVLILKCNFKVQNCTLKLV